MIYVCADCHFMFSRSAPQNACADCGSENIHEANETERIEFEKNKKMHER